MIITFGEEMQDFTKFLINLINISIEIIIFFMI